MAKEKSLTRKEETFCLEIFKGTKATDAYLIAYPNDTQDRNKACRRAGDLRNKPRIQKYLEALKAPAIIDAQIKAADVLKNWVDIATADPADLVQLQRRCCRYCYGKNHRYQWTENEYADAVAKAITAAKEMPDDSGGDGFDENKPPAPDCPDCFGDGKIKIVFADTRNLTGKAKALFAGIKQNSSGAIEILMRNQDVALENIAKYLGMFKIQLGNPDDPIIPIGSKFAQMTKDPIKAAQAYQELMSGK